MALPPLYRYLFLFEGLSAINGSLMLLFSPVAYLETMSFRSIYTSDMRVIFDQLAATYFLFGFIQIFVVSRIKDEGARRTLILGLFLCDVTHIVGSGRELGWDVLVNPMMWRWQDWVNLVMLYGFAGVRVAYLLGVGVGKNSTTVQKKSS